MIVHTLGDPHLGKKFEVGVPLHRRGDREAMQFAHFVEDLQTPCDLHVCMGDLFDKAVVPYSVIWRTAQAYREAAQANDGTTYVVLRGNHDASRDANRVSAFQIFEGLVDRIENIMVVSNHVRLFDHYVFYPWHPFKSAEEMVTGPVWELDGYTAFGHWDVIMGDTNRLPTKALLDKGITHAITGHDHLARDLKLDGLAVTITGSMQPYSHAEDSYGNLYVTIGLADLLSRPDDFHDRCVRLVLEPDEQLDEPVDCLQLTIQRAGKDDVDLGDVDFEAFDLNVLFEEAREKVGLGQEFGKLVLTKLDEVRAARA